MKTIYTVFAFFLVLNCIETQIELEFKGKHLRINSDGGVKSLMDELMVYNIGNAALPLNFKIQNGNLVKAPGLEEYLNGLDATQTK